VDDISNFHRDFTSEESILTSAKDPSPVFDDKKYFEGFDYINQ
jgi:hypothetical protein